MEQKCINRFKKELLGLYKIALRKYNDLYDIYILEEDNSEYCSLMTRDKSDKSLFWNIYAELKTQAELIEYVLKKNDVI
ncbi:TPA: hypothetical protein ACH354_002199 [Clostridium perfringens]